MVTIGLDCLYYAKITEGADGAEIYGAPQILAKAIKADLSVELAEAILCADDAAAGSSRHSKAASCRRRGRYRNSGGAGPYRRVRRRRRPRFSTETWARLSPSASAR